MCCASALYNKTKMQASPPAGEAMLCLEASQAKSSELLVDPIDAELDATGQPLKPQAV